MTRTNAWHAGLAAVAVLLLCSVGRAGAGGPSSVLGVPCSELSAQHNASSIACTKNGSPHKSGPGTSLSVSVAACDVEACTITNVRK